jgi:vacuolar protein sorting-associated protein IST1
MGVQRIQIANNKKLTSVKHQKKEVATLLGEKKDEKARIRVEHIIRDDFLIEAYEMIELLCELLHERIRQVTTGKQCPDDLKETIYSLVWAASNCEITELQEVKKHLVRKYGAEFFKVVEENPAEVVNMRLFNKLSYRPPGRLLVNRYLVEIADVYKVEWEPPVGESIFFMSPYCCQCICIALHCSSIGNSSCCATCAQ